MSRPDVSCIVCLRERDCTFVLLLNSTKKYPGAHVIV
jgi:hypothetical protein